MQYMRQAVNDLVCTWETRAPYRICEYLGIEVDEYCFRDNIKGLTIRVSGRTLVAINPMLPRHWKRFVLAHEIGHNQLSSTAAGYFFLSEHTFMEPLIEREVNQFVVELLVRNEQPYWGETAERFAARVGVPAEMMEYWVTG
jgi:Zn-dependent peptidase ImmA (M78 family)